MSDLIRRKDVLETMSKDQWYFIKPREQIERINAIPTAEPKKGKWIDKTEEKGWPIAECSVCGGRQGMFWMNFCPNCGAKMEGASNV